MAAKSGLWRRATKLDMPALGSFLLENEKYCAAFSDRLLREGEPRLPARPGFALVADEGRAGFSGALLALASGRLQVILPRDPAADSELPGFFRGSALSIGASAVGSSMGLAEGVERLRVALGLSPLVRVEYKLMFRERGATSPPDQQRWPVRQALPTEADALFPLQAAYEREEVLTPIHVFDAEACRASIRRSLRSQRVFVAEDGSGGIAAKAGTNARGLGLEQIGGVYTLPRWRGGGAARSVMAALLADIFSRDKDAALFVKTKNLPALKLYRGLGFALIGDFRIDYYRP